MNDLVCHTPDRAPARRRPARTPAVALLAALALGACAPSIAERPDPLGQNVIDDAGLSNLLLSAGDPDQAVRYFEGASAEEPERADLRRGLALSYLRAGRYPEAARVYGQLDALGQAGPADLLEYAFVSIRLERWADAAALDARLPAGFDTARRHQLTAMIADHEQNWEAADAAYARAEMLDNNPAKILNNWGVSKMARGEYDASEQLFRRAIAFDSRLFAAKNNLAIALARQGTFQPPLVPMTDRERATILNNMGVLALAQDKPEIAKGLFAAAVDTHPQHYQGAADRLASLEATVAN